MAKNLAQIFESELSSFLNLSWIEQLEKAEEFFLVYCSTKSSKNISLMFKALADDEKESLEEASEERNEFSNVVNRSGFSHYLNEQFQDLIYKLPYYFLFSHIISSNTYFQIDFEAREELREICELRSAGIRRDAFTELFSFLWRETVSAGGDRKLDWNKPKRLHFLSIYNRFQIVIKNARKDKDSIVQKRNGKRESVAEREIIEKYQIPDGYSSDLLFGKSSAAELAMDWSKQVMGIEQESNSIKRDVLTEARKEAKKYNATHKLVSVHNLDLDRGLRSKILHKESNSELRFTDFWTDKNIMLYFI